MQRTDLNAGPYFDDYDADKNFHRILFRPKPVQARELNQLQSILMDQISRMGSHIFAEGSMVIPGGIKIVTDQDYVMISFVGESVFDDITNRGDLVIKSNTNNLKAKIAKINPPTGTERTTLFIDYLNSGSNQEKTFTANDTCSIIETVDGVDQTVATVSVIGCGKGTWAKVVSGVWFARGMFVQTEDQDVAVAKYSSYPTAKIGFKVVEEIIDETIDDSLLSNALGYPNFKSPGANRLKVTLQLVSVALDYTDPNFIELARIDNGVIQSMIEDTTYSVIQKALAQRTYETNGDYTINNFSVEVKEHLLTNNNGGVYTAAEGGSSDFLVAALKPGIAYVKGYRVENQSIRKINIAKARDTAFLNNSVTSADFGPYILVKNMSSLPPIDITKKIAIMGGTFTQIGYCRIRAVRKETDTTYRMYIFDVNMNSNMSFGQASYLKYTDANSLFSADLVNPLMYGSNKTSFIFPLPVGSIKTLLNNGSTDTTYSVLRSLTSTTNGAGIATIGLGSNESFLSIDGTNYLVAVTGPANSGALFDPTTTLTLTGSPVGSSITVNLGATYAGQKVIVIAPVSKLTSIQKTKTPTIILNEAISLVNVNKANLSKADIISIQSIVDATTGEDLTSQFSFDNGQRTNCYQVGSISTVSGQNLTRNIKVSYTYYSHSAGDYFSVDSYGGLGRDSIGSFGGVALADALDFRPLKDSTGDITTATLSGEIVRPNDTIRADITYYLPRIDSLYVSSNGTFGVVKGVSSQNPVQPVLPPDSMKLFDFYLPAYTSDPASVIVSTIDNRRYTMRDIGKLETRIKNVEYYTTLSALESKTNATQIFDPVTGNNRYKNGFAVDGFNDFRLADTSSIGWAASIDSNNGQLKPTFVENGSDFVSTSITNAVKTANVYMKSYTSSLAVTQPYATKTSNINPYAVFTWVGIITMNPSSDFWKDVVNLAPVVINNVVDKTNGATQGTVWFTWTGYFTDVITSDLGRQAYGTNQTAHLTETTTIDSSISWSVGTVTTINNSTSTASSLESLGLQVVPYMRSIDITVTCQKFRPFTRLYVFWDDVNVNADCKPSSGNYGDSIVSDASGNCTFIYTVPNRSDKSFRTGTSSIRIIDSATNDTSSGGFTTIGESTFKSGGSTETFQETVTNTNVISAETSHILPDRITTILDTKTTQQWDDVQQVWVDVPVPPQPSTTAGDTIDWDRDKNLRTTSGREIDPIAQTFRVPVAGGGFITKIDLYFATKSDHIPVVLELRTVSTGFPTTNAFARKILNPSEVNISADATVPTSFVFDDPIYVDDNAEYAMVLMADTQEYNVYISELGENIIGQQAALAKQPSLGVFFTSQNASTWTANQMQDLKFDIYRAVFDPNTDATITFQGNAPIALPIGYNAIQTTNGSPALKVFMRSNGLKVGDNVTINGLIGSNGINDTTINGIAKTVVASDLDSFTINASTNATATGNIGGGSMKVTANYPFSIFMSYINTMVFSRTAIVWEYRYIDQATRTYTNWASFNPKDTNILGKEGVVRTGADFQIRATMKTNATTSLSPVIDANSFTTLFVSPRINNDVNNPVYAYETKAIRFDNPSTSATFYIGALLPNGSNMKFYYKTFDSADQDISGKAWTELAPTTPIVNDMSKFLEYSYQLNNVGTFVGYKIRVVLLGTDSANYPILDDFRSIALA